MEIHFIYFTGEGRDFNGHSLIQRLLRAGHTWYNDINPWNTDHEIYLPL